MVYAGLDPCLRALSERFENFPKEKKQTQKQFREKFHNQLNHCADNGEVSCNKQATDTLAIKIEDS